MKRILLLGLLAIIGIGCSGGLAEVPKVMLGPNATALKEQAEQKKLLEDQLSKSIADAFKANDRKLVKLEIIHTFIMDVVALTKVRIVDISSQREVTDRVVIFIFVEEQGAWLPINLVTVPSE